MRRGSQQFSDEGGGVRHLLEVVQDEQQLPVAQMCLEGGEKRLGGLLAHAEGVSNGGGNQGRVGNGGQADEVDALLEVVEAVGGDVDGEAGLAGATGAGQGDEGYVRAQQQVAYGDQFLVAADERVALDRQVVGQRVEAAQWREVNGQVRGDDLEDVLGTGQVLEAMAAQVAQADGGRQRVPHQLAGGQREERLAAVAGGQEAGHAIDRRAEIVAVALQSRAGVEGDTDSEMDHGRRATDHGGDHRLIAGRVDFFGRRWSVVRGRKTALNL